MLNNKKIIFVSSILFCFLFSFSVASAAETLQLKYTFPCSPIAGGTCPNAEQTSQSPAAYIARFYQFALMLAGVLAFAMIIYGAIQYIVSAGSSTAQKDASDRIFQALWGIALLLGAYLILYTIDPALVSLKDPDIKNLVVPVGKTYSQETKNLPLQGVGAGEKCGYDQTTNTTYKCRSGYKCENGICVTQTSQEIENSNGFAWRCATRIENGVIDQSMIACPTAIYQDSECINKGLGDKPGGYCFCCGPTQ